MNIYFELKCTLWVYANRCHQFTKYIMSSVVVRRCTTSWKVPGSIPGRVTWDFFRSIRQVLVPGVDSASKNEYQDIPGGKGVRCVGVTTLLPSCAECQEIREP